MVLKNFDVIKCFFSMTKQTGNFPYKLKILSLRIAVYKISIKYSPINLTPDAANLN